MDGRINISEHQITKRTAKSILKKLDMENDYKADNIYEYDLAECICKYLMQNGTVNTKLSASLCLADIQKRIDDEKKYMELVALRKINSDHQIKNHSYKIINQNNVDIANEAIFKHQWTKEYEEMTGYSIIAKDVVGDYINTKMSKYPKEKQYEYIQKILLMYNNIVRHMRDEELMFEDIAARYVFKESVAMLPIIRNIMNIEACN